MSKEKFKTKKTKLKCGCVVEEGGWFFDVSPDENKEKWVLDNKVGYKLKNDLEQLKKEYPDKLGDTNILLMLMKVSSNKELKDWFLNKASIIMGKHVYGWNFKMGCRWVDSKCKKHKIKIG